MSRNGILGSLATFLFGLVLPAAVWPESGAAETVEGVLRTAVADNFVADLSNEQHYIEQGGKLTQLKLRDDQQALSRQLELLDGRVVRLKLATAPLRSQLGGVEGKTGSRELLGFDGFPLHRLDLEIRDPAPVVPGKLRSVIFVSIAFANGGTPWTRADVQSRVFGDSFTLDDIYLGGSGGVVRFDANFTFHGPVVVPGSIADCNFTDWGEAAEAVLAVGGINVKNADHAVFLLPIETGCPFAGVAFKNERRSYVLKPVAGVVAHEIGHNLGMTHSSSDLNDDGALDSEYGDPFCVMGSGSMADVKFNPAHAVRQDWLAVRGEPVRLISGSGQVEILLAPFETIAAPPGLDRVLVVQLANGDDLYVSYKDLTAIPSVPEFRQDRIQIVKSRHGNRETSNTRLVASVAVNESYHEKSEDLSIDMLSVENGVARVRLMLREFDTDQDGILDDSDPDDDNDGVPDVLDCRPRNAGLSNGTVYLDYDEDGVADDPEPFGVEGCYGSENRPPPGLVASAERIDNCPFDWNPEQTDSKGDGIGDACRPVRAAAVTPTPTQPVAPDIQVTSRKFSRRKNKYLIEARTFGDDFDEIELAVRVKFANQPFVEVSAPLVPNDFNRSLQRWNLSIRTRRNGRYRIEITPREGGLVGEPIRFSITKS